MILLDSGTPETVLDLGRDCEEDDERRGVVGEELIGVATLIDELDDATVWYVRTGSLSTTDLGALQRRRRIRNLSSSIA